MIKFYSFLLTMSISADKPLAIQFYKAGEWYRLTVEMEFQRLYGFYILQVREIVQTIALTSYLISLLHACESFITNQSALT